MSNRQTRPAWAPGQRVAITTTEHSIFNGRSYWVLGDEAMLVRRAEFGWVALVNEHEFMFAIDELTDKAVCVGCEQTCVLLTTIAGSRSLGTWVHEEMPETPHKASPVFQEKEVED